MHNIKRFLGKKITVGMLIATLSLTSLIGCSSSNNNSDSSETPTATESSESTDDSTQTDYSSSLSGSELSVEYKDEDLNTDYQSSSYEDITLSNDSITYNGSNATVDGQTITITAGGIYHISGTLTDGQIIVDASKDDFVWLILDNASITSNTASAIYGKQSDKIVITLADGSTNTLSDASTYTYDSADTNEPNACLFSCDDLTINGTGSLTVNGNYNDGIATKDDLKIVSGIITVNSQDDGIRGKDSVAIKDGTITITASGDGLKSTNSTDDSKGFILIENGTFVINSVNDAIQSEKSLWIKDGDFTITTNGGSANAEKKVEEMGGGRMFGQQSTEATATPEASTDTEAESTSTSYKAIKTGNDLYITGGTFTIDSCDDALHSNNTLTIDAGTLSIATGDDGMHADDTLTINGGTINISTSYEGIEGAYIVINDGSITLYAEDDGFNAAGGMDSSQEGFGFGTDNFSSTGNYTITFNGGEINVTSDGDGLDANGSIIHNGGTVYVNGPTNGGNGSLDYDSSYSISGGTLVAAGSNGMAQTTTSDSTQASIYVAFTNSMAANTEISLRDSSGNTVLSYAPTKEFQCIVLSNSDIKTGETYTLYSGSTQLCTVTPESSVTCITDSGEETTISQMGGGGNGGGRNGGGRPGSDNTDGSTTDGAPSGDMPSGEAPNGEAPSGDMPSGEAPSDAEGTPPAMPEEGTTTTQS